MKIVVNLPDEVKSFRYVDSDNIPPPAERRRMATILGSVVVALVITLWSIA